MENLETKILPELPGRKCAQIECYVFTDATNRNLS